MNTALWVLQGLLAAAMAAAGAFKLVTPKEKLAERGLKWVHDYSAQQVKLIGLAEVVGAIGLIVPWALMIVPILTPIAAVCLAVIMGGAAMTHIRRKEPPFAPIVLGLIAVVIAVGRFGLIG